jgi:hypothetical protein
MNHGNNPNSASKKAQGSTPTTGRLADLLLGIKSRDDVAGEFVETDVNIDVNESCNCRKSRCLKL